MYDFHTHSNYSDGKPLFGMLEAAADAGLEGIGITDHCTISSREHTYTTRVTNGFNLDLTYKRRRHAIAALEETTDLTLYDAVEMDYHPIDEPEIRTFLEMAAFDYTIGSVHEVDGRNIQVPSLFADATDAECDRVVEQYVDQLVSLLDSELFDIAAHIDLFERTPPLRGRATEAQYERLTAAFERSRTVPEINAGRALHDHALVHPTPRLLEMLCERGIPFTLGSDSHTPTELCDRNDFLRSFTAEHDIELVSPLE